MTNKTFYNEILIDHNMHPGHKHDLDDANMVMEGLNPTCGDHIWLKLKVEDGVIVDGSFVGEGCAVSQASADMMLDLIIGQKVEDAEKLADNFLKMIKGTATEEEIESLEEASALEDIPWKRCLNVISAADTGSVHTATNNFIYPPVSMDIVH